MVAVALAVVATRVVQEVLVLVAVAPEAEATRVVPEAVPVAEAVVAIRVAVAAVPVAAVLEAVVVIRVEPAAVRATTVGTPSSSRVSHLEVHDHSVYFAFKREARSVVARSTGETLELHRMTWPMVIRVDLCAGA